VQEAHEIGRRDGNVFHQVLFENIVYELASTYMYIAPPCPDDAAQSTRESRCVINLSRRHPVSSDDTPHA
jgi:hypothetical protein